MVPKVWKKRKERLKVIVNYKKMGSICVHKSVVSLSLLLKFGGPQKGEGTSQDTTYQSPAGVAC